MHLDSFPAGPSSGRRTAGVAFGALALSAALAGCATAPLSFLNDRQVTQRAQLYRYPVFVAAVDGYSTGFRPVPITPGDHLVTIDAPPVGGLTQPIQKIIPMKIEPCTRYYLAAQRRSPLEQDWNLVIEDQINVGGCNPDEEWRKARAGNVSSGTIGSATTAAPATTASR